MHLPLFKAFAEGKRIKYMGEELPPDLAHLDGDVEDYEILPDPPVEFYVVLDKDRKVVALQPNFGSADTARDVKDREFTTNGVCRNVHRVAHCKEVVAESKQLPLTFTTQPKVENEADTVSRAREFIHGDGDYDERELIKGLLAVIVGIDNAGREAVEAAERG
jgi:hypothetical protein